jgi:hypothetical protein
MNKVIKLSSISRSIKALISPSKGVNPRTLYPSAYYRQIFFDKQMYDGIELVAKIERTSKKDAARMLIKRGFSNNIGGEDKDLHLIQNSQLILLIKLEPQSQILFY